MKQLDSANFAANHWNLVRIYLNGQDKNMYIGNMVVMLYCTILLKN
jgi:hypothetical protein